MTCLARARHKSLTALRDIRLHSEDRRGRGQPCLRNPVSPAATFYPRPKMKPEGPSGKSLGLTWVSTRPLLRCPRHPHVSATMAVVDLLSHGGSFIHSGTCVHLAHRVPGTVFTDRGGTQFHILQFHFPLACGGGKRNCYCDIGPRKMFQLPLETLFFSSLCRGETG